MRRDGLGDKLKQPVYKGLYSNVFGPKDEVMKTKPRGIFLGCAGLFLQICAGCQTWWPETGQTLPSANYLQHQPQYLPRSSPDPLPREEASLNEASAAQQKAP
jgi:hypothetical protein